MLSSLKKSSDKQSVTVPAWHPNFRNFERLPDTKAVRTSFFVNGVAIFVVLILAIYTIYREYGYSVLRGSTAEWEVEIKAKKPASDQAIVQFKKFQEEEKQILALRDFTASSKLVVSDLILQLGEILPKSIKLTTIDYKPASVILRGNIEGSPDEASGQATAYLDVLRKHIPFTVLFESITLTNITRDPASSQLRFEINMKFKSAPKPPAAKK